MAQTEDLTPKQTKRASATWQDAPSPPPAQEPSANRQQYGYPSRRLHRTQLTTPNDSHQLPTSSVRTTENLNFRAAMMAQQDADGTPDDTILVPESTLEPRQQFVNPASGKFPTVRPIVPATNELVEPPQVTPQQANQLDPASQLAQLRRRKGKQAKI